ncbi:MAG: histidinol dehydrogenase [Thalassolituus oleivorans]|jgi:histidinol dehydrogenase
MRVIVQPARATWSDLVTRPTTALEDAVEAIRPLVEEVARRGDEAVRNLTQRFDGVELDALQVSDQDIAAAASLVSDELKEAIRTAITNLETFHKPQLEPTRRIETTPGVTCWRKSIPNQSVGLYVPGGTAPLFSTVLMLGVPARVAGCPNIILCTPPRHDGSVHPAILFAAAEVGIRTIFRVGGPQAIAAMTYGTETIPKVDKILGPGNQYVTAAKQWAALLGVGVDMPAGPSEVAILADHSADPAFVAADMLSQAEHGPDSQVFVVVTDPALAEPIQAHLDEQLAELPRADVARLALGNSVLAVVEDREEALDLINFYAPEHLILAVADPGTAANGVVHAGSVFLGHMTPESAGDYASGTNHTLPTGGAARAFSGVSVDSFVRKTTFQEITEEGLRRLGPTVALMASAEDLDGHALAVTRRLESLGARPALGRRVAKVSRQTSETDIFVRMDLDGSGRGIIDTGLGFFDHMLMQIAKHGGVDLEVRVRGDLHVDEHHTVEDTAIALGTVLRKALGDKRGIERYAFLLPMDEALAHIALDLGGRSHLVWDVPFTRDVVGDVPTELWPHFFKSLCDAAACNLNVKASGENDHHVIEAVFKGLARCLRDAVRQGSGDSIPSTKGTL